MCQEVHSLSIESLWLNKPSSTKLECKFDQKHVPKSLCSDWRQPLLNGIGSTWHFRSILRASAVWYTSCLWTHLVVSQQTKLKSCALTINSAELDEASCCRDALVLLFVNGFVVGRKSLCFAAKTNHSSRITYVALEITKTYQYNKKYHASILLTQ